MVFKKHELKGLTVCEQVDFQFVLISWAVLIRVQWVWPNQLILSGGFFNLSNFGRKTRKSKANYNPSYIYFCKSQLGTNVVNDE